MYDSRNTRRNYSDLRPQASPSEAQKLLDEIGVLPSNAKLVLTISGEAIRNLLNGTEGLSIFQMADIWLSGAKIRKEHFRLLDRKTFSQVNDHLCLLEQEDQEVEDAVQKKLYKIEDEKGLEGKILDDYLYEQEVKLKRQYAVQKIAIRLGINPKHVWQDPEEKTRLSKQTKGALAAKLRISFDEIKDVLSLKADLSFEKILEIAKRLPAVNSSSGLPNLSLSDLLSLLDSKLANVIFAAFRRSPGQITPSVDQRSKSAERPRVELRPQVTKIKAVAQQQTQERSPKAKLEALTELAKAAGEKIEKVIDHLLRNSRTLSKTDLLEKLKSRDKNLTFEELLILAQLDKSSNFDWLSKYGHVLVSEADSSRINAYIKTKTWKTARSST